MDVFFMAEIISKTLPLKKNYKVISDHKLNSVCKECTFYTKDCNTDRCLSACACEAASVSHCRNHMDCSPPGPVSMGFSRPEYWSGLPCPPPGDLPNPEVDPMSRVSPALAGEFFTTSATWEVYFRHVGVHAQSPQLHLILCNPVDFSRQGCLWDFPGQNTGVGCHALPQVIFTIQGWNPCLLSVLLWQEGCIPLAPPAKPIYVYKSHTCPVT